VPIARPPTKGATSRKIQSRQPHVKEEAARSECQKTPSGHVNVVREFAFYNLRLLHRGGRGQLRRGAGVQGLNKTAIVATHPILDVLTSLKLWGDTMRYLFMAVLLAAVSPAQTQPSTQMVSAGELLSWCSDGSAAGSLACTAYIMGIADAVHDPSARSCPGSASREQIRVAVMRYIASSSGLDLPAAVSVTAALQAAFPCRS